MMQNKKLTYLKKKNKVFYSKKNFFIKKNNRIKKFLKFLAKHTKKFFLGSFLLLCLFLIYFSWIFWEFQNYLSSNILNKFNLINQSNCVMLDENKTSFALIDVNDQFQIKNLFYFLKLKEKYILNRFEDSQENKFNFVSSVNALLLTYANYANLDLFFLNLQSLFLETLSLKVDFVLVINNIEYFKELIEINRLDFLNKLINKKHLQEKIHNSQIFINTNLCKSNIHVLINKILNVFNLNYYVNVNSLLNLKNYINLLNIYKEQVRVHIENSSGSEKLGFIIKNLFENYGINVVKLDFNPESIDKTYLYIDKKSINNSVETVFLIDYLMNWGANFNYYKIFNEENIFAEIKIVLGNDSINILFKK